MNDVDTLTISLEDFYGDTEWDAPADLAKSAQPKCGLSRVPGGRVVCHKLAGHPTDMHRGRDRANRIHYWRKDLGNTQ